MKPDEAFSIYNASELVAVNLYRDYWLNKFVAAGITLVTGDWYGTLRGEFNGYTLDATIWPRKFEGVKVEVHCGAIPNRPSDHWHNVKVRSDRGFDKLVHALHNQTFK